QPSEMVEVNSSFEPNWLHLMTPPVTLPFPSSVTEPLPARGETPVTLLPRKLKVYLPASIAFDPAASPPFVQVSTGLAWATPTWPAATTAVAASAINMTLNLSIESSLKFTHVRSRPPASLTG